MKRIYLISILFLLAISLSAQAVLEDIYFGDYGEICRTVLKFDRKPTYRIERKSDGKQVIVHLADCSTGSRLQMTQQTQDSRVIDRIQVNMKGNGLTIDIATDGYALIKDSYLPANDYKIVLDIYNVEEARQVHERLSFARFYYKTGFYKKAIEQYEVIEKQAPTMTGIHYYWGMILKSRKKTNDAIQHFQMVKDTASEYSLAQKEIAELGGNKTQKPNQNTAAKPKNEPAQESKQSRQEKPPVLAPKLDINLNIDSLLVQAVDRSQNDPHRLMMAGLAYKYLAERVTKNPEDYKTAIALLTKIPAKSPNSYEKYKALAELYAATGDQENAKLFAGLASESGNTPDSTSTAGFMQIELKLWMALLLMLLFGVVVFFLLMIYYRNRTSSKEDDFTQADFSYHEDLIKKEMEQDEAADNSDPDFTMNDESPEPITDDDSEADMDDIGQEQEPEPDFEQEDEEPNEEEDDTFGSEARLYFGDDKKVHDYVSPSPRNVLEEETALTPDEEESLLDDEFQSDASLYTDSSEPRIGDEEYMQKMIRKLSKNGWDAEAIAKELKISVREVEFVQKMGTE